MAEYIFKFKCRMCGEVYTEGMTRNDNIAFGCTLCAALDRPSSDHVQAPHLISVHCKNDHYGIADFVGCEIKEDKE